jgi:opacity protein-like surface antigen
MHNCERVGAHMKKLLLRSVGLAAMLTAPAMAADMRVAPAAPPPVAYYDWSGAYIGGNVGGVWYDVTRSYTGAPPFAGLSRNTRELALLNRDEVPAARR